MENQLDVFERFPERLLIGEASLDEVYFSAYLLEILSITR